MGAARANFLSPSGLALVPRFAAAGAAAAAARAFLPPRNLPLATPPTRRTGARPSRGELRRGTGSGAAAAAAAAWRMETRRAVVVRRAAAVRCVGCPRRSRTTLAGPPSPALRRSSRWRAARFGACRGLRRHARRTRAAARATPVLPALLPAEGEDAAAVEWFSAAVPQQYFKGMPVPVVGRSHVLGVSVLFCCSAAADSYFWPRHNSPVHLWHY